MNPTVGFASMTHLGLVSASAVASKNFPVVCFDANSALINRLRAGDLPVSEPDLDDIIRANGRRQSFTSEVAALGRCDVVYIATDVPTDDSGQSDLSGVCKLIDTVAEVLSQDALLVILCQVPPGFTRALAAPPPERRYYQVETLVFGRAVERATKPERYIIGCADPDKPLDSRFRAVLQAFDCPILPMRYESAELAKISINMCLVPRLGSPTCSRNSAKELARSGPKSSLRSNSTAASAPIAISHQDSESQAVTWSATLRLSNGLLPPTTPMLASCGPGGQTASTAAIGLYAPSARPSLRPNRTLPSRYGDWRTRKTPPR